VEREIRGRGKGGGEIDEEAYLERSKQTIFVAMERGLRGELERRRRTS